MNIYDTPEEALDSIQPADVLNAYIVETLEGRWAVCLVASEAVDALLRDRDRATEEDIEAVEACIYEAPDGDEVPVISWHDARNYKSEH